MNFQNPFINPYGMPQQYPQPVMPQAPQQQVVRVNGENGARAYQIGANSSALLLDESGTMIWAVTSDGAGYKTVAAYDIIPHKSQETISYEGLESRIKRLEDMINDRHIEADKRGGHERKSEDAADQAGDERGENRA